MHDSGSDFRISMLRQNPEFGMAQREVHTVNGSAGQQIEFDLTEQSERTFDTRDGLRKRTKSLGGSVLGDTSPVLAKKHACRQRPCSHAVEGCNSSARPEE